MKEILIFLFIILFSGIVINCQLIRVSTTNPQVTMETFENQQSFTFIPISSNSIRCSYSLRLIAKDTNKDINSIMVTRRDNDIPQNLFSTKTSTSTIEVIEFNGFIDLGSTTSTVSVISNSTIEYFKADYNITLTCSLVDTSKLTITINDVVNFDNRIGYYSSIRVAGMDNYKFGSLDTVDSTQLASFGRINIFAYVWPPLIFENQRDSLFTITIVVSGVVINLMTKSFYYNVPYPTTLFYDTYPNTVLTTPFMEFGFHNSPLVTITCDTQTSRPYQILISPLSWYYPKPISGKKGKMTFMVALQGSYGISNFSLISPIKDILSRISLPVNIIEFTHGTYGNISLSLSSYGLGSPNIQSLIPLFEVSFSGTAPSLTSNQYLFGMDLFDASWPFGYISGNHSNYLHTVDFLRPLNYSSISLPYRFSSTLLNGVQPFDSYVEHVSATLSTETSQPILTSYNFKRLMGKNSYLLLTANIISKNGVKRVLIDSKDYGLKTLVSGTNRNGTYEIIYPIPINYFSGIISFACYDIYGNNFNYIHNQVVSYEPLLVFKVPDYLVNYFSVDSFDNITFAKNNFNLLNSAGYNTMYLNSSKIDPNTPLELVLSDPVSSSYQSFQNNFVAGSFPIVYNSNSKLFTCDFIIPSNNLFGEISYYIRFTNGVLTNNQLGPNTPKLIVNETYLDNQGPIFSFINTINSGVPVSNNSDGYGYVFNITDDFNGFSSGSITVKGAMDLSKYTFNFKLKDAIHGNKLDSQYTIFIPVSKQCLSQTFIITSAILTDTNGISSVFNLFSNYPDPTINPFLKYFEDSIYQLYLVINCDATTKDYDYQNLVSFKHSIENSIIDVGKVNSSIVFDFSISSPQSGIKDQQSPIVYIFSQKLEKIECISTLVLVDETYGTTNFTCSTMLPIGFGYPGSLIFSIYGFLNNAGFFFGYSTNVIAKYFPSYYYIDTRFTITDEPIITSTDIIYSTGGSLVIYGRSLADTKQVSIYYSDTGVANTITQDTIYGSSAVSISSIAETTKSFKLQIITNSGLKSNEYWVTPVYFESPTTPVIPTNPPQKCIGNPECGGKLQGYCSPNGCICYSPWIGTGCQSKVIVVPPPILNPNEPSTNIITNSTNSESSSLVGVISIVSLRELDINNNVIKTFKFERWNQTNLQNNKNIYSSSIKFDSSSNDCFINVETQWYEELTNFTFANQLLVMNPSTLKYNINITAYPFQSNLNTLQLIIRAKLTQNDHDDNVCSNQEFGDTVTDNSDFIQLSVKDHSLYGRFVKRGIVDGRIISINNVKIDDLDNESNYYTSDSFIGIVLPQFTNLIQLDPDFGLLFDSTPTDSICKTGNSGSSLSKGAKIGIIVGCVGFVFVVAIAIVLLVKYKYHLRNLKSVIKMKKTNKN
ncbi:hypothetical protein ACTA71_010186 [Dictyostelium dimigraforme]